MKSPTSARTVVLIVLLAVSWSWGQEPSPSYEHLKFLEPMVGQWQAHSKVDGQITATGMETSKWILNKSFMQGDGWGYFEDVPVRYLFVTGWNPKTQKVFQWGAGGNAAIYGFQQRIGTYDPQQKAYIAQAEGIISGGIEHSNAVKITIVDKDHSTFDFTNNLESGKSMPDIHEECTRQITVTTPTFDETPGPAYEHLKPCEWLVGNWELRGAWADGKKHEGGEQSKWVFNKNFIQGEGWWNDRDGKRNSYVYMVTWHPQDKNILMAFCGDDGSHTLRVVTYDPQTKTLKGHQDAVAGNGDTNSADVQFRLTEQGTIEGIGTNIRVGDEALPDLKTTFSQKQ